MIISFYLIKKRYWASLSMVPVPCLINKLVLLRVVHQPLQVSCYMAYLALWCMNITYSSSPLSLLFVLALVQLFSDSLEASCFWLFCPLDEF